MLLPCDDWEVSPDVVPLDGWLGIGVLGGWLGELSVVVSPGDPEGGLVSVVLPSIENANFKLKLASTPFSIPSDFGVSHKSLP